MGSVIAAVLRGQPNHIRQEYEADEYVKEWLELVNGLQHNSFGLKQVEGEVDKVRVLCVCVCESVSGGWDDPEELLKHPK